MASKPSTPAPAPTGFPDVVNADGETRTPRSAKELVDLKFNGWWVPAGKDEKPTDPADLPGEEVAVVNDATDVATSASASGRRK